MEEIEVVINITKHEWEYLNKLVENGDQLGHYERLLVNGTPLPKGHGDLIDRNGVSLMTVHIIDGVFVCNAPTIIEADNCGNYVVQDSTTKNDIRDNRVKNELNRVKDQLHTKNDLG